MRTPRCHRSRARTAGLSLSAVLLVALSAGCGTRTEPDRAAAPELGAATGGPISVSTPVGQDADASAPPSPGSASGAPATPSPSAPSAAAGPAAAGSGSAPAAANRSTAGTPGSKPGTPGGGAAASSPAGGAAKPAPTGSAAPGSPATPGGPGTPVPAKGPLSPVILASVGTQSGPAASTTYAITQGGQIWVKHINSKGGLNGHEVKLIVYDDGGDPARHRAQVQEAIEKRGAMAFLANADAIAGRGSVEYINSKRIPHIGTMGGISWAYETPMFFPQASDGDPQYFSWVASMANQLKDTGKKKLGVLVCVEAPTCSNAGKMITESAPGVGYEVVYSAKASIAQPDFTAECLAARNGGAEVFMVIMDSNSMSRVIGACARQSYKPVIATGASIVVDRFKDDPNMDGMVASTNVFPWFQKGTPATDEYQAAMKAFGGGAVSGVGTATGWTAGKLLERAAVALAEPPTSTSILQGLWSIKGDDLGGITNPITFTENQPAKPQTCWFNLAIRKGQWISPDGFRRVCQERIR